MSSRLLKWSAVVLVIVGAAMSWMAIHLAMERPAQDPVPTEQDVEKEMRERAVIARERISDGTVIEPDLVSLEPVAIRPEAGFQSLEDVVGKQVSGSIGAGEPVLERHFRQVGNLARRTPAGTRAMAMSVGNVSGVGGYVEPGDYVDLVVFLPRSREVEQSQSGMLLSNIQVLAFGSRMDGGGASGEPDRQADTAVLAIPEEEVGRFTLGLSSGTVRMALHGRSVLNGDDMLESSASDAVTLSELETDAAARRSLDDLVKEQEREGPVHRTEVHRGGQKEEVTH